MTTRGRRTTMATRTIRLGTFSLSDFCDCDDPPCPECCPPCCGRKTLHVDVQQGSCGVATIVVTYDPDNGWWAGSGDVVCGAMPSCGNTKNVQLRIACPDPITNQYVARVSCDNFLNSSIATG